MKAPSEHELNSVNITRLFGDFPDIAINRSTIAALCSSVLVEPTERFIPCWRAKALARLTEVNEALKANDSASLFFRLTVCEPGELLGIAKDELQLESCSADVEDITGGHRDVG